MSQVDSVLRRCQVEEVLVDATPPGVSGALVIEVRGEIRQQMAVMIREALLEFINRGLIELYLDLSRLQHIDSAGVGVIVHLSQQLKKGAGRLVIVAPSAWVQKLFGVVKIDRIVEVIDQVPELARSLRSMRTLISKTQSDS